LIIVDEFIFGMCNFRFINNVLHYAVFGLIYFVDIKLTFRGYYVFKNDDEAEKFAHERVVQDLNDEPGNFNQSFLEGHINTERLDELLWSDW
jgi:hypothetical protein